MKGHDRFESLAGAVALGEATDDERRQFEAHSAECTACREDLDGVPVLARVAEARDSERWQPSIEAGVLARVRERRATRSRWTITTLAWAAGLSIAVNVVIVTGFSSAVINAFAPSPPLAVLEPSHMIRLPAQTFAHVARPAAAIPRIAAVYRAPRAALRAFDVLKPAAMTRSIRVPEMSDPLGGLLAADAAPHRHLAIETSLGSGTSLQP